MLYLRIAPYSSLYAAKLLCTILKNSKSTLCDVNFLLRSSRFKCLQQTLILF